MKVLRAFLSVFLVAGLLPAVVIAHTKFYVQHNVQSVLRFGSFDCGDGRDPIINLSFGGYCFGTKADHTMPDDYPFDSDCVLGPSGECTITTVDDLFSPIFGTYCQDLDDSAFCGDICTSSSSGTFVDLVGESRRVQFLRESPFLFGTIYCEPRVDFCDSITINTPVDFTPRGKGLWIGEPKSDPATTWVTNNWDPDSNIFVFLGTIDRGSPVFPGPCGAVSHQGSHGFGTHAQIG